MRSRLVIPSAAARPARPMLLLAVSVALAACAGKPTAPPVTGGGGGGGGTASSLEVTPATASAAPGGVVDFEARIRTGTTTTPATDAVWSSSQGSVAQVSGTGRVTALAAGTAWVVATRADVRDSALLTVQPAPAQSTNTCDNEPAGLTSLTSTAWDAVPPYLDAVDANGWGFDRNQERVSIVSDPSAPRSPGNVAAGLFPAGWDGGRSPFRLERPFGRTYRTIYQCLWLKHSPNFTDNGNVGTKVSFYRGEGTNHYWAFDGGSGTNDGFYFFFGLQAGAGNRDWRSNYSAKPLGVWRKYEILVVGNTPGQADGVVRVWVNGSKIIESTNVAYWTAAQTPGWHGIAWDPTYGGGTNRVPYDMYMSIDHWYVSGGN